MSKRTVKTQGVAQCVLCRALDELTPVTVSVCIGDSEAFRSVIHVCGPCVRAYEGFPDLLAMRLVKDA
jgi:hypothetical protein